MKPKAHTKSSIARFLALGVGLSFAGVLPSAMQSARAATNTWAGSAGSTDWATAANWSVGSITTGDALVFTSANASASATLTNTLATTFNAAGITFNSGALGYTMSGNSFNLTGVITNNATGVTETFNNNMTVVGGTWSLASGTTTTFNGNLTSGNIATLFLGGTTTATSGGTVNLNGTNTLTFSGATFRALILQGTGTTLNVGDGTNSASLTLNTAVQANSGYFNVNDTSTLNIKSGASVTVNGTSNATTPTADIGNTSTAGATVNIDGTLTYGTGLSLRIGYTSGTNTGVMNVNSGGVLNLNGTARTITVQTGGALNIAGTVNSSEGTWAGAGKLVLQGGTFKATAAQTLGSTLAISTTSANSTINTNGFAVSVGSAISGSGGLTKSGTNTLTLSGANTYTGATTINAGTLALGSAGSLSSTTLGIAAGATLDVSAKSSFSLSGDAITLSLDGSSIGTISSGSLAVSLASAALTLNVTTSSPGASYDFLNSTSSATGDLSSVTLAGSFSGTLSKSGNVWSGVSSGYSFSLDQTSGALTITAVPESKEFAIAIIGLLGVLVVIRRRKFSQDS